MIENPYAQATVENFRRTPASLRPQLLKMLEREMSRPGINLRVAWAHFGSGQWQTRDQQGSGESAGRIL
jgi:hypothetical protein